MNIIQKVNNAILTPLITLLFAVGVIYFLYGLFRFIQNQGNEKEIEGGKSQMVWGIVGIAIMVGVYGILHLIQASVTGLTS